MPPPANSAAPLPAEAICRDAASALCEGRFDDTARLARRALEQDDDLVDAWIHLAHASLGLHRHYARHLGPLVKALKETSG